MGAPSGFDAPAFLASLFAPPKRQTGEGEPNPRPADAVGEQDSLPPKWREAYKERAAIRHYEGEQPEQYAEAEALREVLEQIGTADSEEMI